MEGLGNHEKIPEVSIVSLDPSQWQSYKEIRLRALEDEPNAFGASYDESAELPDSWWQEALERDIEGSSWHLFAKQADKIVGTVSAKREKGKKNQHLVRIFGVYVAPEARGNHVGKELMQSLLERVEGTEGVIKVALNVSSTQEAAHQMYKSFGFRDVGLLEKEMIVNGEFVDEYAMEKFVDGTEA